MGVVKYLENFSSILSRQHSAGQPNHAHPPMTEIGFPDTSDIYL